MKLINISIAFISLCLLVLIGNNSITRIVSYCNYKESIENKHQHSVDSLNSILNAVKSMSDAIEIESKCYSDSSCMPNIGNSKKLFFKKKKQIALKALETYRNEMDSIQVQIDLINESCDEDMNVYILPESAKCINKYCYLAFAIALVVFLLSYDQYRVSNPRLLQEYNWGVLAVPGPGRYLLYFFLLALVPFVHLIFILKGVYRAFSSKIRFRKAKYSNIYKTDRRYKYNQKLVGVQKSYGTNKADKTNCPSELVKFYHFNAYMYIYFGVSFIIMQIILFTEN